MMMISYTNQNFVSLGSNTNERMGDKDSKLRNITKEYTTQMESNELEIET